MKFLSLLAVILFLVPYTVFAGRESGAGGGNGFEGEMRRYCERFYEAVFEVQSVEVDGKKFDWRPLNEVLRKLHVNSTKKNLVVRNKSVTAINYPRASLIVFNSDAWSKLDSTAKMQLTIHELLGLRYRSSFDDTDFHISSVLLKVTQSFTVERVALAMARAGNAYGYLMKVIPERTKLIERKADSEGLGNVTVTEVAIQTFENSSNTSIRVYRIKEHDMVGTLSAELDHLEGAAGG